MTLVIDNFLPLETCNSLIEMHKSTKNLSKHRNTEVLNFNVVSPEWFFLVQHVSEKYEQVVKTYYGPSVTINYSEVVCWPAGELQDNHLDFPEHIVTSVLYLNDNYKGGNTFFECGTHILPKLGRIIFFEGNKIVHGVTKIISGERWTSPTWYIER